MSGPARLRERIPERSRAALASGALAPIATRVEVVPDGGVAFAVRVVEALARKSEALRAPGPDRPDPFLPPDPALVIGDISATHVAVLNKFPVIEGHVLIVTRAFEDQSAPLSLADFEALAACLEETDGLGFYNAGARAGASQRHKHLQLVPRALGPGPFQPPVESVLPTAGGMGAALPFRHAFAAVDGARAAALHARYREMLRSLGIEPPAPYNLLATRRWMLGVPRAREDWQGISVNALGFAGALLAKTDEEAERIRRAGPMRILVDVSGSGG